jgi:hypothetical protein
MTASEGAPNLEQLTDEQLEMMGLTREELKEQLATMEEREKIAPVVGDEAPDFEIKRLDADGKLTGERVRLSDMRGKPVALAFGSYT